MTPRSPHRRLADHGAVGDGRSTALVDATGAVDWWAPDGPDQSPACFSLVDARNGGEVRLGPSRPDWTGTLAHPFDEAPVLDTTFSTPEGAVEVHDHLVDGRLVRRLEVVRGRVEVVLAVRPGERFGPPRRVHRWSTGMAWGSLRVEGMEPGTPELLHAGERRLVTITVERDRGITRSGRDLAPLTWREAVEQRDAEVRRWRADVGSVEADVPHRNALLRSVRALRLLTVSTTSDAAVLRALTTSLPPRTGNDRNLDERYAWLRDNAAMVRCWERLGHRSHADAHRSWLAARADDDLPLAPVYRADGDRPPSEQETVHPGWEGHGPVRTGQRAGELLDLGAIAECSLVLDDRSSWPVLGRLGDWLAEHAHRADHGRWDERTAPRRHVESAIAVRHALEALVATARGRDPFDTRILGWVDVVRSLDAWLREEGRFGAEATAGWRRIGGTRSDDRSDAALLRWLGSTADAPTLRDDAEGEAVQRARATLDQTIAQLGDAGLCHRHLPQVDDGLPPGQGADLWASASLVSALAALGRWEEAHERMDALLRVLGPCHLGATHADPLDGDLRGNLLAAPVHLALVDAALALGRGPR